MSQNYFADCNGFYGEYGGAFIPEMLVPNVEELKKSYRSIVEGAEFQKEFQQLLKDFVGRPTALYHAKKLSNHYQTNIYLKREDLCHTGAHKINNAIGQVMLAKRLNKTRIIAETGAGQHGVATASACALLGVECIVYMGALDVERQQPNVKRMQMMGAKIVPVESGSKTLKDATNEALRDWIANPVDTYYVIGSVVGPHPYPEMVAYFQSVISAEIKEQMEEQKPTHIIACVGGGSNAIGAFYHYLDQEEVELIGIEAAGKGVETEETAATLTNGTLGVLHGSKSLLLQDADGQIEEAYSISAGLDYPGTGPQHAYLMQTGRVKYFAVTDDDALKAAYQVCKLEGIIPALETAHAFAYLEQRKFNPDDVVVINLSGRGDKDLETYQKHFKS